VNTPELNVADHQHAPVSASARPINYPNVTGNFSDISITNNVDDYLPGLGFCSLGFSAPNPPSPAPVTDAMAGSATTPTAAF
jgi:hypothetical protein